MRRKHGERLHVVNLYNDEIGNSSCSDKMRTESDSRNDVVHLLLPEIAAATRLSRWRLAP